MKTLNIQNLLKYYKIDVEHVNLDDTFELEDMFHRRNKLKILKEHIPLVHT